MDGQTLHLALDIPERQVESADGVGPFAACGIEEGAIHVLPETLDILRVAADQSAGGLATSVSFDAALADAGDACVGLDGDHHVALVEAADWDSAADRRARA